MTADIDGTYLERIVEDVRAKLGSSGGLVAVDHPVRSLAGSIVAARGRGELGVIAEFKRRSPSVGAIAEDADLTAQVAAYADGGACGISVLTEPDHFGGRLADLTAARDVAGDAPVLRKDFVLEAGQIDEARAAGADAVLLITALHDEPALAALLVRTYELGLDALVEVHDEQELDRAIAAGASIVGINSRDLRSFVVDLAVVDRLAARVPADVLLVAESGIRSVEDAERVRAAGVDAVLVGELLMRSGGPEALVAELAGVGAGARR